MQTSDQRILTTHVGSLPRPRPLADLLIRQERGEAIDASDLQRQVEAAVDEVVRGQLDAGIDVGNDGEQPRVGFQTYVAPTHAGLRRRERPAAAARLAGLPGLRRHHQGPPPPRRQNLQRPASACRGAVHRPQRRRRRVRRLPAQHRAGAAFVHRALHDRGVARHYRHHAAERPLRVARALRLRPRRANAQGVRADSRQGG